MLGRLEIIRIFVPEMRKLITICLLVTGLWLLTGCGGNKAEMLQQLEALEQQNRSGEPMLNDSLAESLVDYFDRHGDANERMRSRYILGRTYYCLGELPRALEIYNEAADCADTTAADCDFAKLSRVYAQKAAVYYDQIQARAQLENLRKAEYSAWKGNDTLMAIECFAQQANAYELLNMPDSVILMKERAANLFTSVNQSRLAVQTLSTTILPLLEKGEKERAKDYLLAFEKYSGNIDNDGEICKGREIYYYVKGKVYLAVGQLDSAEMMFRKELVKGINLNHQIAGYKGLQEVYEQRKNTDSIAKYANLGYILNDSAYSLSEMQNIQKFQASYNYNHQKLLAEQSAKKAQRSLIILIIIIAFVSIVSLITFIMFRSYKKKQRAEILQYKKDLAQLEKLQTELQDICSEEKLSPSELFEKKHEEIVTILKRVSEYKRKAKLPLGTLEDRLGNAPVVKRLRDYADSNPYQKASLADFTELKNLINEEIPHFYTTLNTELYTLSSIEYDVSLLLRTHFSPTDIHKLTGMSPGYVSNMRSRLLLRVYGIDGSPSEYDKRVLAIH